jgi:hypothetical protein
MHTSQHHETTHQLLDPSIKGHDYSFTFYQTKKRKSSSCSRNKTTTTETTRTTTIPTIPTTATTTTVSKMSPFYPFIIPSGTPTATATFPSSTAPQPPMATHHMPCPYPHHHNMTDAPHNGTHHHGSDGIHIHPYPSNSTTPLLNVTTPTSPGCDGCEPPILPDAGLVPRNATLSGVPGISQAQASSPAGPGYHSKETGMVLMVVLVVAGVAVALGALYWVGRVCWALKTRKAEKQRVTSV